jgi:hypothetical protein
VLAYVGRIHNLKDLKDSFMRRSLAAPTGSTNGVWGVWSDDAGLIQSIKAPKHQQEKILIELMTSHRKLKRRPACSK